MSVQPETDVHGKWLWPRHSFYLCLGKKISGLEPETQNAVEIIYF